MTTTSPSTRSSRHLALLSGFLGATASCLGKFAFDSNSMITVFLSSICVHQKTDISAWNLCDLVSLLVRGLCFVLMLACNAFMLGSFVKGMEESGSVAGTALSSASNFVVSAVYGYFLWDEHFTLLWGVGFSLVLCGIFLLSDATVIPREESSKKSN